MALKYKHEFVREDKNGTKYYKEWAFCPRCGGSGNVHTYQDGGICYKCGGSGGCHEVIVKEYTPEYAALLEARRQAKYDERFAAAREAWVARKGFNAEGTTYCILDRDVDKEAVKAQHGTWSPLLGWHAPVDMEQYKTVTVKLDDYLEDLGGLVLKKYQSSYYCTPGIKEDEVETWGSSFVKENVRLARETLLQQKIAAGEVNAFPFSEKEKVQITASVVRVSSSESAYGTAYIYVMRDESGNNYRWRSTRRIEEMYARTEPCGDAVQALNSIIESKCEGWEAAAKMLDAMRDEAPLDYHKPTAKQIVLAGTVKENSIYNGQMTTVLTRCKVAA